jgi:hypothetical protein
MPWWDDDGGRRPPLTPRAPARPGKVTPRPGPSVYEGRVFGLAARLRRLFAREREQAPISVGPTGHPVYAMRNGRIVGYLCEDGSVVPIPPCCDGPEFCEREECWTPLERFKPFGRVLSRQ